MENGNGTAESAYANLFNVRNQFTMWGPDSQINDYAARHYSGLMLYYRFVWLKLYDKRVWFAHTSPTHLRSYLLSERWSTFFDFTDKNACGKEQIERYFGAFSIFGRSDRGKWCAFPRWSLYTVPCRIRVKWPTGRRTPCQYVTLQGGVLICVYHFENI